MERGEGSNEQTASTYKFLVCYNKLTMNISKTEFITFGCYYDSVPENMQIMVNDNKIERKDNVRYLGLLVDYNLKWHLHITSLINKIRYFLYILRKLRHLPHTVLEAIYYAHVFSRINYGIIIWGGAYATELKVLERMQARFAKILHKKVLPTIKQLHSCRCVQYHYGELRNK